MSADPPDRQKRFDERHDLGFGLLSDPDNETTASYGARREKKMYGNTFMGLIRSAFLIDAEGRIEQAWYGISPKDTPRVILAALEDAE